MSWTAMTAMPATPQSVVPGRMTSFMSAWTTLPALRVQRSRALPFMCMPDTRIPGAEALVGTWTSDTGPGQIPCGMETPTLVLPAIASSHLRPMLPTPMEEYWTWPTLTTSRLLSSATFQVLQNCALQRSWSRSPIPRRTYPRLLPPQPQPTHPHRRQQLPRRRLLRPHRRQRKPRRS